MGEFDLHTCANSNSSWNSLGSVARSFWADLAQSSKGKDTDLI